MADAFLTALAPPSLMRCRGRAELSSKWTRRSAPARSGSFERKRYAAAELRAKLWEEALSEVRAAAR